MASAKEGLGFSYQAVARGVISVCCAMRTSAISVTALNRPNSAGVVRAMASSDHWRWVSIPRWARASAKVTSTCQRSRYHWSMCSGFAAGSVHSNAHGLRRPSRFLTTTQRMARGGSPPRYQTAAPEVSSTVVALPSDETERQTVHWVAGSSSTAVGLGQTCSDDPGPPILARPPRWRWLVPGRVLAQLGDDNNGLWHILAIAQELALGVAAITHQHQVLLRQPSAEADQHLPSVVFSQTCIDRYGGR